MKKVILSCAIAAVVGLSFNVILLLILMGLNP